MVLDDLLVQRSYRLSPFIRRFDLFLPSPTDPSGLTRWGDYHFGKALRHALACQGIPCRFLYRNSYRHAQPPRSALGGASVLLVLRGKIRPTPSWVRSCAYHRRLLWIISWPSTISEEELAAYDLVFVASKGDLLRVARLTDVPCVFLPQATGFTLDGDPATCTGGLVFVGNCRGKPRPLPQSFLSAGLRVRLFGGGWREHGYRIVRSEVANAALPALYRSSLAVLNDHHPDMATHGYLSNRLFDILACGVPAITDFATDCPPALLDAVVVHGPSSDPKASLDLAYRCRCDTAAMRSVASMVSREHSFHARVRSIMTALADID